MFAYCENNPVNNSDPTGESFLAAIPGGGIVGTMVAGAMGNISGDVIRGNISSVSDIGRSALKGAAANGIGYGTGMLAAKTKVNNINIAREAY